MNDVSRRFQGSEFIEVVEGGYYNKGTEQHALLHDEDGMPKTERLPMKSQEVAPPVDEVKQAADEAAKAAQEAAKVAAEASQNLMKGLSSFGGGFLGGGKQQKSGGGGLLGGFGFGGAPSATTKPAQNQSKPAATNLKGAQTKPLKTPGPKVETKVVRKEITAENLERKPFTANMTSRQRWYWSFRMIQQVNVRFVALLFHPFSGTKIFVYNISFQVHTYVHNS